MRNLITAALPALCLAKSIVPTIYTYDPQSSPATLNTVDPIAARLVLAQRLGVEDYHHADLQHEGVMEAINEYGRRQSLFAKEAHAMKKALLFLEGEANPQGWSLLNKQTELQIAPCPNATETRGLFIDLARQSGFVGDSIATDKSIFDELKSSQEAPRKGKWLHVAKSAEDLSNLYDSLVEDGSWSITVLSMPPNSYGQLHKSGETAQWGTYELPNSPSQLKKRQQKEAPLTETSQFQPVHSTSAPFTPLADSTPLRGILPSCFATQSACESATRNCTGHGSCKRKYHDEGARGNKDCFSCQCGVSKSSDGKSTTVWAGPACQKKDISVQFWLIALFTVGMVFLIGFAVGQIWEMGEQELPSVIGAGVSGPSARK